MSKHDREYDIGLKRRIKKLLFESDEVRGQKEQRHSQRKVLSESVVHQRGGGMLSDGSQSRPSSQLALLTSKRDEVALRHRQKPSEPLFETYEDYVAYMISDDVDRPQYSTFVSMGEYEAMRGRGAVREESSVLYEEFDYDGFGSIDEYWKDSVDQILREEKRREERYQERARKRQQEWEERQSQREWEERQQGYEQQRQRRESQSFGGSVQDRIAKNKQRLLNEFGLPSNASFDDVKSAYRQQMKQWHPDKFASQGQQAQEEATRKTQMLNESYQKILRQDFS